MRVTERPSTVGTTRAGEPQKLLPRASPKLLEVMSDAPSTVGKLPIARTGPLLLPQLAQSLKPAPPPETPRIELREEIHGQLVEDPYRWLERPFSQEQRVLAHQERRITEWKEAQNARFLHCMRQHTEQSKYIEKRLLELIAAAKANAATKPDPTKPAGLTDEVILEKLKQKPSAYIDARATSPNGKIVGSSRVDLQACKLEYSIVSPK